MLQVNHRPTPCIMHVASAECEIPFRAAESTVNISGLMPMGSHTIFNHLCLRFLLFSRQPDSYSMSHLQGTECTLTSMSPKSSISPRSTLSPPNELLEVLTDCGSKSSFNGPLHNYKTKQKQLYSLNTPTYWQGPSKIPLPNPYQFPSLLIKMTQSGLLPDFFLQGIQVLQDWVCVL